MAFTVLGGAHSGFAPARYRLFISHDWEYQAHLESVGSLITRGGMTWEDLSVRRDKPLLSSLLPSLAKSHRWLVRELDEKIAGADCVIVLAGMYVAHSEWIQSEIEAAMDLHKPIIAVRPRGSERVPAAVSDHANEIVGWNSDAIVSAIRRLVTLPRAVPGTLETVGYLAAIADLYKKK